MAILKSLIVKGGIKSVFFVWFFELSRKILHQTCIIKAVGMPIRLSYRIFSRNIMHLDIEDRTMIGKGFIIWHGAHGSVINPYTIIGDNFQLRQNTTIGSGSFTNNTLCPTIEDNVDVGPNCCILGKITIGHNSQIGGGSVVVHDVPPYSVVAGNPARIIKKIQQEK